VMPGDHPAMVRAAFTWMRPQIRISAQ
jgi:hypothetical protein